MIKYGSKIIQTILMAVCRGGHMSTVTRAFDLVGRLPECASYTPTLCVKLLSTTTAILSNFCLMVEPHWKQMSCSSCLVQPVPRVISQHF